MLSPQQQSQPGRRFPGLAAVPARAKSPCFPQERAVKAELALAPPAQFTGNTATVTRSPVLNQ